MIIDDEKISNHTRGVCGSHKLHQINEQVTKAVLRTVLKSTSTSTATSLQIRNDIFIILCMFEKCRKLRTVHPNFKYYYVECYLHFSEVCINEFSDSKTDESKPPQCNKTFRVHFLKVALNMTKKSYERITMRMGEGSDHGQ